MAVGIHSLEFATWSNGDEIGVVRRDAGGMTGETWMTGQGRERRVVSLAPTRSRRHGVCGCREVAYRAIVGTFVPRKRL
jgi:hypothetical protein